MEKLFFNSYYYTTWINWIIQQLVTKMTDARFFHFLTYDMLKSVLLMFYNCMFLLNIITLRHNYKYIYSNCVT